MLREIDLILSPKDAASIDRIKEESAKFLAIDLSKIAGVIVTRRSIDARKSVVVMNLKIQVWIDEQMPKLELNSFDYKDVKNSPEILIIGAGPSGLFAALRLIEKGFKPIILERGKKVSERKRDVASVSRNFPVDPDSNYCFGEGGAGTFSDGKLYTRSQKRGNPRRILEILTLHGADENILTDAHPHIGSNILPRIVTKIRETIENSGGVFYFNTRVVDFIIENEKISGVITKNGDSISGQAVILATGHSSRDIYEILHKKNIKLEAKSFAMGVRVEHPQGLIDSIQYKCEIRDEYLPAASYNLVTQSEGRGVYSFCMCPGGVIVPAATAPNQQVVNGMSSSSRNSYFANSGIVVEIKTEDFPNQEEFGSIAGLKFQQQVEEMAFLNGGDNLTAPAQVLTDFVKGKLSGIMPETSYHPGIISSPVHFWLPDFIGKRLQAGFKEFGKKMYGYLTEEAVVLGVESRTSSPVRIPRNSVTLEHIQIKGLFPVGEGAGYAGGIVSAAVDGERCAESIALIYS